MHRARRQLAESAWDDLNRDQRDLVHTLMQATVHRFTLERLEADGWQGALYEASRMDVMTTHNFLTLPPHLQDLASYLKTYDPLVEYGPEERAKILAELKEVQ